MMKTKILYVDDEESLRTLVKTQLSLEGYDVQTADDGDVALEILQNESFDLVLLDIRMPRMNGIEVLKTLRKCGNQIRVIMLTAVSDLSSAILAVKSGANDYLTKPYKLEELLESVNRVLSR